MEPAQERGVGHKTKQKGQTIGMLSTGYKVTGCEVSSAVLLSYVYPGLILFILHSSLYFRMLVYILYHFIMNIFIL